MKNGYLYTSPEVNLYVTGDSSWTTTIATAQFYLLPNKQWIMKANILGLSANTSNVTLTIAGIAMKGYLPCRYSSNNNAVISSKAQIENATQITIYSATATTVHSVAVECLLSAVPTMYINNTYNKTTKNIYESNLIKLTATSATMVTGINAYGQFYLTPNNKWKVKLWIWSGYNTSATPTITIQGLVFSIAAQVATGYSTNNAPSFNCGYGRTMAGTGSLTCAGLTGPNPFQVSLYGEFDLSTKPTMYLPSVTPNSGHDIFVSPMVSLGVTGTNSYVNIVNSGYFTKIKDRWFLTAFLQGFITYVTNQTITISGIKTYALMPVHVVIPGNQSAYGYIDQASNVIHTFASAVDVNLGVQFTVPLMEKPTQYLADNVK